MAINVTLGEAQTQEKPFPKLMIYKPDKDYIVLFTEEEKGTVVWTKYNKINVGQYDDCWAMSDFADYNEPLTLQNK